MAVSKPHLLFQVPLQINFMRKTFLVLRYAVRGSFVVHIIIINFGFNCFMFVFLGLFGYVMFDVIL